MLKLIRATASGRPLLATLTLTLFVLLNALPGHAQSEPAAPSAPEQELFNAAILAPVHESPAPGTVSTGLSAPPVGVPTLRWTAVPDAVDYNVQISVSEGFATTEVNQETTATEYTPIVLLADGTFFWRVRAKVGREWGNFSEPWSFHKDWSAGSLLKPLLFAPADDSQGAQPITNFSPEQFSWEPVPGAAAYILEISVSPSFNDAQIYRQTTLKPHHTPTRQFANSQYYWRVIPLDNRDRAGAPSDTRTFTFAWNQVPLLLTPENDIDSRFLPRFTWTAVPGASEYIWDLSTEEDFSSINTTVRTPNNSYTPEKNLSNNRDYFWRVRAVSPQSVIGPASEVRRFRADWVQPPSLLSPPTRSIYHIYPYFSWTPVAGAERYQIRIGTSSGSSDIADKTLYNATAYTQPEWRNLNFDAGYFWSVRAIDAQGNTTNWGSEQSFRIVTNPPPNLIYPESYYAPDAPGMPVHTDRTIAHPLFVWDNSHEWMVSNGPAAFIYPDYYLLEVANDLLFADIVFTIESAGQAAAPTETHPFDTLVDGNHYYWRVTPMRDGARMDIAGTWGTVWETRIDRNIPQLPRDNDVTPDLLHPAEGFIAVGAAPVLGWLPVSNAHSYEVQISTRRDFATIADSANALFPYYVPWQGRQEAMPMGAYWWKVRAKDAVGNPLGDWSSTRRLMIADELMTGSDLDYMVPITGTLLSTGPIYDPALSLAAISTITPASSFDMGALHVIQDRSIESNDLYWVVAFGVTSDVVESATYALYLDVNQQENVGGTSDPRGKPIITDPLYRPEYVIYLDRTVSNLISGSFYEWNGSVWQGPFLLSNLGGISSFDPVSQAVQVRFPYATIILENTDKFSGALALTAYSTASQLDAGPQDSIPTQGTMLETPALVSNMPMPLFPFDTPLSNPTVFRELPTLRWRMPHFNSIDGYQVQISRNADFTQDTIVETWESYETGTSSLYGPIPTAFHSAKAYNDDESYYWRIRYRHEKYDTSNYDRGPWSPPVRFKLTSYQVGNPTVTVGNPTLGEPAPATPSFTWQRVEGAAGYTIQVDDDFNMGSPLTDKKIDANSYTSLDTLADGTYYWRVAMRRSTNVTGQWTSVMSFTKTSLVPTLVGPINGVVVNTQPTFVWSDAISNTGELHIATPKYRLQWANNPQFNTPTTVETESTAYTPLKGQSLSDGTWYWRVAVIDADKRRGPDSPPASFYKEYLQPELLSPLQGSSQGETISFEWSPLNGAAYYKLEIDDNDAFDSPIKVSTDNTRYTHTENFVPGDFHWRVQMVDKDNKPGPTVPGRFSQTPGGSEGTSKLFIPVVLGP